MAAVMMTVVMGLVVGTAADCKVVGGESEVWGSFVSQPHLYVCVLWDE
jgi:hypothetical protein